MEVAGLLFTTGVIAASWLLVRRYQARQPRVDWRLLERRRRALRARRRQEQQRPRTVTRWIIF
jgi:hypothetical protein